MITKTDALAAVRNSAHEIDDGERTIVHVLRSFTGADWDLADVEKLVEQADHIEWEQHALGHDLAIIVGQQVYRLDVRGFPEPNR